ncbi:MAG: DUF4399 domain-containing protein [Gemmatimonadota bacterium]
MTSPSIRSIALAGLLALGAPVAVLIAQNAPTPAPAVTPAAPAPEIFFRAPANGATVGPTFPVVFGLRNYGVAPAGVRMSNTGHFHVLIDTEAPAAGVVIPGDSLHRHFGAGQIETTLTLSPGTHTLRLVLGDADHKAIGPALVSAPIRVTVRPR